MECRKCNQNGYFKRNCPELKKFSEGASRTTNVTKIDDSDYYTEGDVLFG